MAISAKCAPARGSRHTDARCFVLHPNTWGTFPDAGGDGSGRYSSSSHSRPDRFRRTGPHPDTAARIRRLGVASASTGPTAPASAGPTEPASTVALIPTTTPSGEPAATSLASGSADAGGVDREHPTREPCPLGAVTTPIIEDVAFVGGPPAYSADGQWVAFSARPSNGALGPDIYVWHVDDAKARPLTTDHSSVFFAWDVDQTLGSVLPSGSTLPQTPVVTIAAPESAEPSASPSLFRSEVAGVRIVSGKDLVTRLRTGDRVLSAADVERLATLAAARLRPALVAPGTPAH